jgi:uncharacterized protein (DUF58 family)
VAETWIDPRVLAGIASLELAARTVVEGFLLGLHRAPTFGFSQEFADYRQYEPGDDPRFIDWNVYGRTNRVYLKRYRGETNTRLTILLDASASMGYASSSVSKLGYAKLLAGALALLASRQHDAIGLIVFDEAIRAYRPPSSKTGWLRQILHVIETTTAGARTDLATAFEQLRTRTRRRGMVAVISDLYCDPTVLAECVRPLAYGGQDVMLLQVLDPGERQPDIPGPRLLVDSETGEELEVTGDVARTEYPARLREHLARLASTAADLRADHVLMSTDEPLDQALRRFLVFRQRRQ